MLKQNRPENKPAHKPQGFHMKFPLPRLVNYFYYSYITVSQPFLVTYLLR